MSGRIIEKMGDVTTPQRVEENETVFIPHVCNDIGKFGSGVALAIARKWPSARLLYMQHIARFGKDNILGRTLCWKSDQNGYKDDVVVCHMIAQHNLIGPHNPRPLNYGALVKCMIDIRQAIINDHLDIGEVARIHCPKFGSERAGGDFNIISELIDFLWVEQDIDVVLYQYAK